MGSRWGIGWAVRGVDGLIGTPLMAALLISLALAACGDEAGEGKKAGDAKTDTTRSGTTESAEKEDEEAPEGVPVKVSPVMVGQISDYLLFNATVEAEEAVDVYSRATGLVSVVVAEEGDVVERGQVLVRLVDDDLKLSAAEAKIKYQKLESQFRRTEEIFSRKLVSNEAYEQQRYDLDQARIVWERAKLALDHAGVRAPVAGVISERIVKIGDRIGPSEKLYAMVNMERLISRVFVPGREMMNVRAGQRAKVTTDFLPGAAFAASVIRISPVVDPNSGTFKVTLELEDDEGQLRPGMFVNTHIITATHDQAVLVPKRAVVYDDGLPHVFVVEDTIARQVRLEVGFEDSEHLEVVSGLSHDQRIVVVGQNGLKDLARIRIIEGEGLRIPTRADTTARENQGS